VDVTVHPDNEGARALYRAAGFSDAHAEGAYFGPGRPRVVMRRTAGR
jgi:ribosomal protein S18 acetylase RimI-like enzyme